jgi:hypothetical protein
MRCRPQASMPSAARSGDVTVVVALDRLGAISPRGSRDRRNGARGHLAVADSECKKLREIGPAPLIQHAMAFDTN